MEVYKILPKVRGGAQRAEGSVVEGKLLYYCLFLSRKGAKHRKVLGNNEGDICVTPGCPKNFYKQE